MTEEEMQAAIDKADDDLKIAQAEIRRLRNAIREDCDWQKKIDFTQMNVKKVYPSGVLPDDINQFLRDVERNGIKIGKQCAYISCDDIKELKKEMETLRDQIADEFSRFDDNLDFYIKELEKKENKKER